MFEAIAPLFFKFISSVYDSFNENDIKFEKIQETQHTVIGLLKTVSPIEEVVLFIEFDECQKSTYRYLCNKFGYDDEIYEAFPCKNPAYEKSTKYIKLQFNKDSKKGYELFVNKQLLS